jgi:RNA polymerase sigma-70 factor (ECF subfamily)
MGEPVDDAALVQRCLSGDGPALQALVHSVQSLVFGLCYRMLGDRQEAEDATQDVLLRVVRNLDRWDSARPLKPWVLTIAANRCRTRLTRRQHQPSPAERSQDWPATDRRTTDLAEELQLGIDRLRPDYKTCFVLFYQQELSVDDIARAMDCPTGTIKTWLYRARKELCQWLKDRGAVTEDGYELHGL